MYKTMFFIVLFGIICTGNASLAPFINKCKWDDTECLKASTQIAIPILAAGIPALNVESVDPFYMKSLDASSPGLKLLINDIQGTGLKDCIAKKVLLDESYTKLTVKLLCTVDFTGKYEMKGHLLVLPIEGKGDAHVILRKLLIDAELELGDVIGADGEKHWKIINWTHTYNLKEKATIELENLFNGNELLGRAAREVIDNSSVEIVKEVGPPIVKAVVARIIEVVNSFFAAVPKKDLSQ